MPKAESSDAYLDRVMALASSQARLIKAHRAAAANRAGANTANDARLGTTSNKTPVGIQNVMSKLMVA